MGENNIHILISENYNEIPDYVLEQTAILRWGDNKDKLGSWVNFMRVDPFGFNSFYAFALINDKVVGFAYFCQEEKCESHTE